MSEKHVLVNGGTVYCSQSASNNSPGSAVPITVTSQTLVDANGGKPVATEKDDNVANMNFGTCNDPRYSTPPPCMAKVKWNKVYEGVQIDGQELLLLTEESEAICNTCSIPGQIKVAFHGQQATVTADTMAEAEPEIMENLNPLSNPIPGKDEEILIKAQGPSQKVATVAQINSSTIR